MKKTYINPTLVVVRMNPVNVIMASPFNLDRNTSNALDEGDILVKESGSSDVNVWDDEW